MVPNRPGSKVSLGPPIRSIGDANIYSSAFRHFYSPQALPVNVLLNILLRPLLGPEAEDMRAVYKRLSINIGSMVIKTI